MRPGTADVLGAFLIALLMSGTMSFAMVWIKTGLGSGFLSRLLAAWGLGLLVGMPTGALVVPAVQKLVKRLGHPTDPPPGLR